MKKHLLIASALVISSFGFGQTTDLGGPRSWNTKVPSFNKTETHKMSGFDYAAIQAEDAINDVEKAAPWRFGYKYDTDISPSNSGEWIDLANGKLWRVGIECSGALSINLLLEDFNLPEGASLYLFDANKTNRVGAYTSRNNRPDGDLGTELVHGDKIFVEYYEPNKVQGQGTFKISNVIHGYRSIGIIQGQLEKALNSSGDCNIDVNCPLGTGWDDQIRSVAMIVSGGNGVCTGALINNTCDDGTPYFLTANHCLGGGTSNWAFRFNWQSPPGTESCATTAGSTDPGPPYDQTANGATILVSGGDADHALLQIDNMTITDAQNWSVFYAGWNNDDTDGNITQATGIHHPAGDVKKICREDNSPYHSNEAGADVWYIDQWEQGVTEGGSSGSPLFDQNGRIIGQLYGGLAACSGTSNNGDYDYYGRLGVSWGLGIGDYLDPVSCGGTATTNDGWDPSGPALPDDASIQSVNSPEGILCGDTYSPTVTLRNAGGNDLVSCVINYNLDGGPNQTYNWSGLIAPNNSELVALPNGTGIAGAHVFNAFTTLPNGVADTDASNDASLSNFTIVIGGIATYVTINTDCYGYETAWEITDAGSSQVAFGGNLSGIAPGGGQNAGTNDPGNLPDETTITETLCLVAGCYDFTIYDDWGDGIEGSASWGCNTDGSYEITNSSSVVLGSMQNVDFGDSETINFCVSDDAGINEFDWLNFNLYPNPSSGVFHIEIDNASKEVYTIEILDLSGRIILQDSIDSNTFNLDMNDASNGTYLLNLRSEKVNITKSIVLGK